MIFLLLLMTHSHSTMPAETITGKTESFDAGDGQLQGVRVGAHLCV